MNAEIEVKRLTRTVKRQVRAAKNCPANVAKPNLSGALSNIYRVRESIHGEDMQTYRPQLQVLETSVRKAYAQAEARGRR